MRQPAGPSGRAEQAAAGERRSGADAAGPPAAPDCETRRLLADHHSRDGTVEPSGQWRCAATLTLALILTLTLNLTLTLTPTLYP